MAKNNKWWITEKEGIILHATHYSQTQIRILTYTKVDRQTDRKIVSQKKTDRKMLADRRHYITCHILQTDTNKDTYIHKGWQTNRQKDSYSEKTGRQTKMLADRWNYITCHILQTDTNKDTYIHTGGQTNRQTKMLADR